MTTTGPGMDQTMTVTVRFFAGLREALGCAERSVEVAPGATVAAVFAAVAGDLGEAPVLAAVNHQYAAPERVVESGDEVAFFPPVTGG